MAFLVFGCEEVICSGALVQSQHEHSALTGAEQHKEMALQWAVWAEICSQILHEDMKQSKAGR